MKNSKFTEVIVVDKRNNYYIATLSGRWYIQPHTGELFIEVCTFNWLGNENFSDFVNEDYIREIQGEYC